MAKNVNLQALKSLTCFSAVTFFSTSEICSFECFLDADIMSVLYFLSIIAKPLFFMIIGYLDEVGNLGRKGVIIKIKSIILIMVFWNIISSLIKTQYIQQGYILQNGILLNMGIIYLLYPLIVKGLKNLKITAAVFISMIFIVAILDLVKPINTQDDPLFISNYSFIWIWAGYYILGHVLGEAVGRKFTKKPKVLRAAKLLVLPLAISMYFYELYLSTHIQKSVAGWFILEHFHLVMMSLALFILFDNLTITSKLLTGLVKFISPAMVGVYVVHYSVFHFIVMLYDFNNNILKLLLLVLVFIASVLFCRLLLLNRFTARTISF
ncbi:acyltransferase family protein [Serratia microhaemolytica]|uniref:acyltransferase family protein n=1 Tax=Serratia microhaemolytica TaxID=2675110 RepID=UPI000FDD93C5|nr:acyltransferase family protein [Serratia microhaemolytica]